MMPEGWTISTLPDVIGINGIITDGDWIESKDQDSNGDVRLIQLADIGDGRFINKSSRYLTSQKAKDLKCTYLHPGDILIARMPEPLGRACIFPGVEKPSISVVDVCIIHTDKNVDRVWLTATINSQHFRSEIVSRSSGSTRTRISRKNLAQIKILLPQFKEQQKIAAILSSVDDAIQATQAVIDQTRRVKQGLLQQLLTRGTGHTRFKQTEIGEIPEEWEVMTVNEIVSLMKSGLSRRILPQDIGIPVLISGNIQNGKLDTKELKFWYEKDPQGARVDDYILKDGDILLCFINSLSQIGKLCLYEDIGRSAIYTTNLFRIQLKQPYSPNFGYYIFSAPFFQKEIDLIAKPAVNQASFTKADFLRILIPIPPKEERDKVVKILESVDYNLETAQIQLRTVQKLKRGLMQDLLTGRVRVKPDREATT